jgi:photosystem II stability/assembly factor-like uncharacterized protein
MTNTNDLTPEEGDERNQHLLRDLRHLYPTQADMAQPLTRIQQRLFHSNDEMLNNDMSIPPTLLLPRMQQARANVVNTKGRRWQHRFNTFATALVAALVVGLLLLVLNLAHQNHTGTARTLLNGMGGVTLLHMIDGTTGWSLTENAVLRTTDGGSSWKNVTPTNAPLNMGSVADFHTASLAWILTRKADTATAQVLRTADGGQTWQQSTFPSPLLVKRITFIDAQQGWILLGKENAGGAAAEPAQILRTTDSGRTWQNVSSARFSDTTPPGYLPYGGQKSGIYFLNASTGWVTGTVMLNDLAWLYVTHDGGKTWYQQTLARPEGVPSAQLSILAPTFFSAANGLLPVRFSDFTTGRGIATVIYVTHDGGTTWQSTTPVSITLGTADFLDRQNGWVTDGTTLFVTRDGGQHWTKLAASPHFKNVSQLDFISRTIGWAITGQGLLKTMDGGQTWAAITPTIP